MLRVDAFSSQAVPYPSKTGESSITSVAIVLSFYVGGF
jgi:hypothetical protein